MELNYAHRSLIAGLAGLLVSPVLLPASAIALEWGPVFGPNLLESSAVSNPPQFEIDQLLKDPLPVEWLVVHPVSDNLGTYYYRSLIWDSISESNLLKDTAFSNPLFFEIDRQLKEPYSFDWQLFMYATDNLEDQHSRILSWELINTNELTNEPINTYQLTWLLIPEGQEILLSQQETFDQEVDLPIAVPGVPTWPNGQPVSPDPEVQKFYRTAYSRGSQIQIGETIYPNLGFNALQRQPESWGNLALAAIDNSFQGVYAWSNCDRGDFTDDCADALLEGYVRLWNSEALSLDLQWTMHSLSGPNSPFPIADRTYGTPFGAGQSLGFRLSKNFSNTFGVSFGADRLIHLDDTTDLAKNLYIMGTKIVKFNQSQESPILSISVGLKSDTYNPDTLLGTIQYPDWLLGGGYPSIFAEIYDGKNKRSTSGREYYPNVAGVTSPFVCAEESIFAGKSLDATDSSCIKKVFVGPVASIGFAPWPWLGIYAIYEGNINLGLSVRPFKEIPWNISIQAIQPFTGINYRDDEYIRDYSCRDHDLDSCRTRVGLYTDFAF